MPLPVLQKFVNGFARLAYKASTKISLIFFSGIAMTIAGGAVTFILRDGGPASYDGGDERFPASMQKAGANTNNRVLPQFSNREIPLFDKTLSARSGEDGRGAMPAEFAERANNQNGSSDTPSPVSVIPPEGLQESANLRQGQQNTPEIPEGASTSTSASTTTANGVESDTNATANAGSSTDTSTSTTTTPIPATAATGIALLGSASGMLGFCQKVTLILTTSAGAVAVAPSNLSLALSTDEGTLYSDVACSTTADSVSLNTGEYSVSFYFRGTAAGTASVTASNSSLTSGLLAIALTQPTAVLALGQANFTANAANNGGLSGASLFAPGSGVRVGAKFILADSENHRVLIWNNYPTTSHQAADLVLGQPNLAANTQNNGGVSSSSLSYPDAVASDGTRLLVADRGNHRVLIWNTVPTSNQAPASIVLGQANMGTNADNSGGLGPSSLSSPGCVAVSGTVVAVCDSANNRVLLWNSIPTADGEPAAVAVGQPDTASSGNSNAADGLDGPYWAHLDGSRLLVSDFENHRVLLWNTLPTASGTAADVALGQPTLTANTANNGGISAATLNQPGGITSDSQGRLYVNDLGNSRLLVWNQIPSTNGTAAQAVIGQTSFTANGANNGGIGATTLNEAWGVYASGSELWVSDLSNHRVLKYELP